MALLFMDGFDAGTASMQWIGAVDSNVGTTASTRFSSGLALTARTANVGRSIPASSQIFMGLAMSINNIDGQVRPYLYLYGDGGTTLHLSMGYTSSSFIVYRGNIGSTVLASYPYVFTASSWYSLEISATIADSGGTCVVKLNGATVINFTGDTKNGGTNTTIDRIYLGSNGGFTASFDDLYVCDATGPAPYNTFLGDVRIYTSTPSGAGASTQFTSSSGANYSAVDELPYSATDYVYSGTSGHRDTYAISDLPAATGNILAVQNNIVAKKTDAAAASLKPAIVSGGTVYYGSTVNLGPSDTVISDLRVNDPATSSTWTASGVNGLEAGAEIA